MMNVVVKYQGPAKDHTFVRLDKGWLVASYDWFPTFSIEQLLPSPRYLEHHIARMACKIISTALI